MADRPYASLILGTEIDSGCLYNGTTFHCKFIQYAEANNYSPIRLWEKWRSPAHRMIGFVPIGGAIPILGITYCNFRSEEDQSVIINSKLLHEAKCKLRVVCKQLGYKTEVSTYFKRNKVTDND